MYVNWKDKKNSQYNLVQDSTTFNYDLNNEHIM